LARKLVVLDPGSLLGEELVPLLSSQFPQLPRAYLHTRPEEDHLILQVAGEAAVVAPLGGLEELEDAAAIVLTARPAPQARERLAAFFQANPHLPCLDASGAGVLPGPPSLVPSPEKPQLRFPDPLLLLPSLLLQALARLEPREAFFTVLAPVSSVGGEALDELAAQAVARLSGEKPRAELLPAVLAFDAIPYPEKTPGTLQQELQALFPATRIALHPLLAGVFHAHSVLATFRLAGAKAEAKELLSAASFVAHRGKTPLAPSRGAGEPQAAFQLLGSGPETLTLWAVGDHLLLSAQAAAQALEELLRAFPPA